MKTIFKSALLACAALTVGLAGCSKDDDGKGNENNSVFVQFIESSQVAQTRAEGPAVPTGTPITITTGKIYFTDAGGTIMDYIDFGAADALTVTPKTVTLATAKAGFLVKGLPGSVAKVVIAGNIPSGEPTEGNISAITVNVANQLNAGAADATGAVAKYAVYGESGLTLTSGGEANEYDANVTVYPVGARVEITSIAGNAGNVDPNDDMEIKTFELEGIYINNFIPQMGIQGLTLSDAIVNNAMDDNLYTTSAYGANGAALTDEGMATSLAALSFAPTTGVWGYNTLALSDASPVIPGDNAPHIIMKVSNVVISDGTTNDAETFKTVHWLTIRNLYDTEDSAGKGAGAKLAELRQGYVYQLGPVQFNKSHLTIHPEMNSIDVNVTATLINWTAVPVGYDFE